MNLTPHFTVEEFVASDTAVRKGINNDLPASMLVTATNTAQLLEQIRDKLSALAGHTIPIVLTSGFRCLDLNRALGSDDSSDHVRGMAADFKAPAFGTPYQVACALAAHVSELGIGQLIHEYGTWVHVSTRRPDKELNRIITISQRGKEVGVVAA